MFTTNQPNKRTNFAIPLAGRRLVLRKRPIVGNVWFCGTSHEDTLGAAAGFLFAIVDTYGLGYAVASSVTAASGRIALHLSVESADFSDDIVESIVDIGS